MSGVQKELTVNKQPWLNSELKLILKSLEGKLERKILHDVDVDLGQSTAQPSHGGAEPQSIQNDNAKPTPLRDIIRNCLALLKYLQHDGDIEFVTNKFHLHILEAIRENFDNKDDVMHAYSKSLVKIIHADKGTRVKKQENVN